MLPRVCIFDLDGTLFDSRYQIFKAVQATRKSFGLVDTGFELVEKKIGKPAERLFEDITDASISKSELVASFREFLRIEIEVFNPIFPGTLQLLNYFRGLGVRLCVATNKPTDLAIHTIKNSEIADFFDHIQGTSGFYPKPHSGMLLECLGDTSAQDAIMFGDTPDDVLAAISAQISVVGVAHRESDRQALVDAGAQFIISDFEDLTSIKKFFAE
jgi:phosphoglycolate phosphatase